MSGIVSRGKDGAIMVISRLWPGEDFTSIEERLAEQPARVQTEVTLCVLGYPFLTMEPRKPFHEIPGNGV